MSTTPLSRGPERMAAHVKAHPVLIAAKGALLLLALVPLVVDRSVLFPYVTGKALLIQSAVALAAVLCLGVYWSSPAQRALIAGRMALVGRSPLGWAVALYFVILAASTAAAANPERAFFGDLERNEGLMVLTALFGFYLLAASLFEKADWRRFFQLTIAVGVVLFLDAGARWHGGEVRPGSFTGHPTFLAPYCIFVIAAAMLVSGASSTRLGKSVPLAVVPLALATVLISQTRAAMLGIAIAAVAVLALLAVRGPRRRTAAALLVCLILAAGAFMATRGAPFWQRVPGIARVASWDAGDGTTRARLGAWEASARALSPASSGWSRVLIGWGPENFHVPFNRHYAPAPELYDVAWYDRSHNKLADAAIMTGLVGLASYLAMWVTFFGASVSRANSLSVQSALLFAGVAYFVQNLVSFDSLTTYVPFFGVLAYATVSEHGGSVTPSRTTRRAFSGTVLGALALFSVYSLAAHSLPAYAQLRRFAELYRERLDFQRLLVEWNDLSATRTYARPAIVSHFLTHMRMLLRQDRRAEPLLAATIAAMEDVVRRDSLDPRQFIALGEALGEYADVSGRSDLHRNAEAHLLAARALAPGRSHPRNALALNRARLQCRGDIGVCYYQALGAMVAARNAEGATLARERLELLDPPRKPLLEEVDRRIRNGNWDSIGIWVTGGNVTVTLAPDTASGSAQRGGGRLPGTP